MRHASTSPGRRGAVVAWATIVTVAAVAAVALVAVEWPRSDDVGFVESDAAIEAPTPVPSASARVVSPESPAAVGVRTVELVDPTRPTPARGQRMARTDRSLTVTIRYPTAGSADSDEQVDAEPLGPAPLVVFAHGLGASAERYSFLLHELASFGFVVAAPEFPMSSSSFGGGAVSDLPEQAHDVSFVISALTGADAPPDIRDAISPGGVGLLGHSDGAVTVLAAGYAPQFADPRIGAVVAVAGDLHMFGGRWFSTLTPPLVAVHGGRDEINPMTSSYRLLDNDPGPVMLVEVEGASHLGSVVDPVNGAAVARLAAFDFLWRLSGVSTARDATYVTADTSPLRLVDDHD